MNRLRGTAARSNRHQRGQSLIEFAILVPAFVLILFGMLEFGFVFSHNLTIQYATREGARTGAALANGGSLNCPTTSTVGAVDPDPYIIAAVERVLTSPGSPIDITRVSKIEIWQNDTAASGSPKSGKVNTWTYTGATGSNPVVDGTELLFAPPASKAWTTCERDNASVPPDSLGVSLTYSYKMTTPLSAIGRFFGTTGPTTLTMTDKTVMALNPTN